MKKIILPVLGLAAAFAFSPLAGANAATMHHKHPVAHHHVVHHPKARHVVHHKAHHVVHHKKTVHHKKHAGAHAY